MNLDEKEYEEGNKIGKGCCIVYSVQELHLIECPRHWSEAKANGFYDAIADHSRNVKGKQNETN